MLQLRRNLLKGGASLALLGPWLGTGLLLPTSLLAAEWNRNAFTARNIGDALKAHGSSNALESRDLLMQHRKLQKTAPRSISK